MILRTFAIFVKVGLSRENMQAVVSQEIDLPCMEPNVPELSSVGRQILKPDSSGQSAATVKAEYAGPVKHNNADFISKDGAAALG